MGPTLPKSCGLNRKEERLAVFFSYGGYIGNGVSSTIEANKEVGTLEISQQGFWWE